MVLNPILKNIVHYIPKIPNKGYLPKMIPVLINSAFVSLKLVNRLRNRNPKGLHSFMQKFIVICLNQKMHMIILESVMQNFQSLNSCSHNRSMKGLQDNLVLNICLI